jgi:predicted nucleotidyltransferase
MVIGNISVPKKDLKRFCKRWKITKLELFGSALKGDFTSTSDVDLLVEFDSAHHRTLSDSIKMHEEIEEVFGRKVDLIVKKSIEKSPNPYKRAGILNSTQVLYVKR